jgi:hypothetical protein
MANGRTPNTLGAQAKDSAKIYGLRPRVPDRTPPLGPVCMFRCVVKVCHGMSAFGGKADVNGRQSDVCF